MLKRFSAAKNQVQSKSVPKMAVFRKFKGVNIKYSYRDIETPRRHFLTRNDVFWRILRKNPFKGVGCSLKTSHPKCTAKSTIWGAVTPEPIATKFCMSAGSVQDVITHANFGEDRLRGFGLARGRILAFSIDKLLHMCSITWPVHRGSRKTTRNNFLAPNCLFTIQLLWGYAVG